LNQENEYKNQRTYFYGKSYWALGLKIKF